MSCYLLAHDLGTSGNKAVLYDSDGNLIKSVTYSYPVFYSNNNWAEQNPDDWWKAVCETTREMLADINPADVAGVSFSGQMMGCVCVDQNGEKLRNSIIWADMRASEEVSLIRRQISDREFYRITGHRISASYGGEKLMWLKRHEPEVYKNTYKMLNAKDYIILKLTGRFVTEYTDASSTCLMDLNRMKWSEQLLDIMGILPDKLPELCSSTDIAGYVGREAAELTGLLEGTPVVLGGGDGVCAAVGTGCVKEGTAHSCMGTSSWISITSKKPVFDEEQKTFTWAHIVPGYVLPTGTMQCGGGAYAWFTKELGLYERQCAQERGIGFYDVLEEELAQTEVGSNGLLFLPYLLGERAPRWNPEAKGGFIGLKMEHSRSDMLRAVQEGVALNLSIVLDTFRKYGEDIQAVTVIGGGAKSAAWRKILADVYDVKIRRPDSMDEATSMGAAITAGVGTGVFQSFDEAERFLKIEEEIVPDAENHRKYVELRKIFNEAYESLVPVFEKLSAYKK